MFAELPIGTKPAVDSVARGLFGSRSLHMPPDLIIVCLWAMTGLVVTVLVAALNLAQILGAFSPRFEAADFNARSGMDIAGLGWNMR
jgi:hypothetical protein